MKMEPPTIYLPSETIEGVEMLLRAFQRLDRGRLPAKLVGVEPGQEIAVSGFGRDMGCDGMGKAARRKSREGCRGSRADEAVEQDGNAALAGGKDRAEDRSEFASADCGKCGKGIAETGAMEGQRCVHDGGLARQPGIVDASPPTHPVGPLAAE